MVSALAGDSADSGRLHELCVFGENTARVAGRKWSPAFSASFQHGRVDK